MYDPNLLLVLGPLSLIVYVVASGCGRIASVRRVALLALLR
jgi:hypothetical protein